MLENVTIIDIVTAATAVFALGISLWAAYISKRNLIATAITSNRIEWIKTVRSLIVKFLMEYESGNPDQKELICLYEELMLYFNPTGKTYVPLVNALKKCLNEDYSHQNAVAVISGAQTLLDSSWVRMKREAGITEVLEARIVKDVHEKLFIDTQAPELLWNVDWAPERPDAT